MTLYNEKQVETIPCGYQEQISEGKTLVCGMVYRGHMFYCRNCMTQMLKNAHGWANGLAKIMLLVVNDHAIDGKIDDSTIHTMRTFLTHIGCISNKPEH